MFSDVFSMFLGCSQDILKFFSGYLKDTLVGLMDWMGLVSLAGLVSLVGLWFLCSNESMVFVISRS